jgi:hypothetical protein
LALRLVLERLEALDLPAVPFHSLPILPFENLAVIDHSRAIAALGRQLGRRPDVVLKIGDSNSSPFPTPEYLAPLGGSSFDPFSSGLAAFHSELLDTWWDFRTAPNALAREGPTAAPGWRTPHVLAALPGEIERLNPGIALVMIGTNDAMVTRDAAAFRDHLGLIVEMLLGARVVPVLSTIPDSHFRGGTYETVLMAFNQIIADTAEQFTVPLWNAWVGLHRLPNHGLRPDGVHLNASPNGAASFWPADLLFAQNIRNLQALQILDWFRESLGGAARLPAHRRDWQPLDAERPLYSVARDAGASPRVDVYDARTGALVNRFLAFSPEYTLGVHVAMDDTDSDGFTDVICSTVRGGIIRIISGADGSLLGRLIPFGDRSGLSVAVGDLDGDGAAEIVAAHGGRDPFVRVFAGGSRSLVGEFRPFPEGGRATNVAVADVERLGPVITIAGGKTRSTAEYFSIGGALEAQFGLTEGLGRRATLAALDLDADGIDELVVGRNGPSATVSVFDASTHQLLSERLLGPIADRSFGIRLGVLRSEEAGDMLLVASTPGSQVAVRGYAGLSAPPVMLPLERANRAFGIFVG